MFVSVYFSKGTNKETNVNFGSCYNDVYIIQIFKEKKTSCICLNYTSINSNIGIKEFIYYYINNNCMFKKRGKKNT